MNALESPLRSPVAGAASGRRLLDRLPPWLRTRRALVWVTLVLVGAGLAFGWPWIVAAGLASLAAAVLPCAAMCAVGLCVLGKGAEQPCGGRHGGPRPGAESPRGDA